MPFQYSLLQPASVSTTILIIHLRASSPVLKTNELGSHLDMSEGFTPAASAAEGK